MKNKPIIFAVILAAAIVLAAFGTNSALASTGCFNDTNGHWAETYICWLKDNAISAGYADGGYHPESFITRAEMAVMLNKVDTLAVNQATTHDATTLTSAKTYTDTAFEAGEFYTTAGPSQWRQHTFSDGTGTITLYTIRARLGSSTGGNETFMLNPTLPVATYGHKMYLDGVKICYDASLNAATLNLVELGLYSGGENPSLYRKVVDTTVRSDAACREYRFTDTSSILGTDIVYLMIDINTNGVGNYVDIFNVTFITHVTSQTGVLSPDETEIREPVLGLPSPFDGSETAP